MCSRPSIHSLLDCRLPACSEHYLTANADIIETLVQDLGEMEDLDQPNLLLDEPCDLPAKDITTDAEDLPAAQSVTGTSTAAAADGAKSGQAGVGALDQSQLLAALGGTHLTSYMGKVVPGWEQRPKVGEGCRACGW
jgi:hypothetical protein